jgi:lysophospholipase L1-like esterase
VRLLAFGDSFVAGVGDPDHLGWIGRALKGRPETTLYNLGVRRETSLDIARRWRSEAEPRLSDQDPVRIIFSFGGNDTHVEPAALAPRVALAETLEAAAGMLVEAGALAPVLLVGPPPSAERAQLVRLEALNGELTALAARLKIPFIDVLGPLARAGAWLDEARAFDGAHPGAGGYQRMADLVAAHPAWRAFTH